MTISTFPYLQGTQDYIIQYVCFKEARSDLREIWLQFVADQVIMSSFLGRLLERVFGKGSAYAMWSDPDSSFDKYMQSFEVPDTSVNFPLYLYTDVSCLWNHKWPNLDKN